MQKQLTPPIMPILKRLLRLALSTASIFILNNFFWFLIMLMVAHLGENQLAAAALISITQTLCFTPNLGFLVPVSVLTSNFCGANKRNHIGGLLQNALMMVLLTSLPFILIMWNIKSILIFFGQPALLASMADQYFKITLLVYPALIMNTLYTQLVLGIRRPASLVLLSLFETALAVTLGYSLIFGKLGAPSLGIQGAALAIVLATYIGLCIRLIYLVVGKQFQRYDLFRFQPERHHIKSILKLGWPIFTDAFGKVFALLFATYMIGWLGPAALASLQISTQMAWLIYLLMGGFGSSAGVLIAKAHGARQFNEIKIYGRIGIGSGVLVSVTLCAAIALFPHEITRLYVGAEVSKNFAFIQLAATVLTLFAIVIPFESMGFLATCCLRAIHETKIPMFIGQFVICFISLPLIYLFGFTLEGGMIGATLGFLAGALTNGSAIFLYWQYRHKRLKPLTHHE